MSCGNSCRFANGRGSATNKIWIAVVLLAVAALCGATASAQTLTWNGGGGGPSDGSATWDLGTNWWNGGTTAWSDSSDAVFGVGIGSAGTVSINNDVVSPHSITFNTTGDGNAYTITGGSIDTTANIGGSLPVNVNVNATIASPLTGAGGLTVNGPATLTLGGSSTYTGATTIASGTLKLLGGGAPLPAGLVDRYTFAGTANDSVGTSNGVLSNGASLSNTGGKFGNGYVYLNGTGGQVLMGALPSMTSGQQARTISAWVEQTSTYPGQWNANYFGFNAGTQNQTLFYFDQNGGVVWTGYADDSSVIHANDTSWHLYTATWDGNTGDAPKIYCDGVFVTNAPSGNLNVGNVFGVDISRHGFQGYEDDLQVYNVSLGSAQVAQLYASAGLPPTSNLLPVSTALTIASGGTLDMGGVSQQVASLSDSGSSGGSIINSSGVASVLTLSPTGGSTIFSGTIQGGGTLGAISLVLNGNGTQVLAGLSTYSGSTAISSGTLQIGQSNALPATTALTLGSSSSNGTLDLHGNGQTIGGLAVGAGATAGSQVITNNGSADATLTYASTGSSLFGGVLQDGPSNKLALQLNQGKLTLTNANTYSGGTTVGSGAALLAANSTGSATGTNNVTVNSGGTLGGSGFVGNQVNVSAGGTIAPNPAATGYSTLTLANLSMPSGGTFSFNISAGSNDVVAVSNNLTLGGAVTFNVAFPNGLASGTFNLLGTGAGTTTDTSTITPVGTPAESYQVNAPGVNGNNTTYYELVAQILNTTWNGNSGAWDLTSNNWTGPGGTKYISGQPVYFTDTASGTVSVAANVTPYSATFSNNTTNYTLTGAAGISGAASVALTGTGTVILANSNSYTGPTTIGPGATLQIGAGGLTGTIAAASAVSNSGTLVISRSDNASTNPVDWTNGRAGYSLGSTISGPGGVSIVGGGYLQLTSTANSFSGQIYIQDGYLAVNNAGNLGNSTSILIGDTTGSGNAGIYNNNTNNPTGPLLISQNIHVQGGSSGVAFLAGQTANTFTTTYSGSIQVDKTTNIYPGFWGGIAVTGPISGVGGLNLFTSNRGSGDTFVNTSETFQGNVSIGTDNTTFQNNQSPGSNFAVYWDYKPATNAAVNTSFGQGTITMQNNQGFDFFVKAVSSTGTNTATMTNPINVLSNGGGVLYGDTANSGLEVAFSGPISLAGQLAIGVDQGNGASVAEPINYAGQVTLDRSATGVPSFLLTKQDQNLGGNFPMGNVSISGNIVDGSNGAYSNPLFLNTYYFSSPQTSLVLNIAGTANTYTAGTVVATGVTNVAANSSLGSGFVAVEPNAVLRLNAASNVAAGSVVLGSNAVAPAVVTLGADFDPASVISSASQGILGVDTNLSTALNMANEGNGMMFLGSVSGGTYSAASLSPGGNAPTPGTGVSTPTYRLGGGGSNGTLGGNTLQTLTISQSNVLTGTNNLTVGQVGGMVPYGGAPYGVYNGGGDVFLAAPQVSFSGTVLVNGGQDTGAGCCGNNGTQSTTTTVLELALKNGVQALGSGNNNVYLNAGALVLDQPTSGGSANVSVGDLNLIGGENFISPNDQVHYQNVFTIGGPNGIVRTNGAVLQLRNNTNGNTSYTGLGYLGTAGSNGIGIFVTNNVGNTNAANGSLGMVTINGNPAPWIMNGNGGGGGGSFMAYSPTNGLIPTTYTVGGVVGNVTGAAGQTLANTIATDMVYYTGVDADNSLTADHAIYALYVPCCTNNRNPTITAGSNGPINLMITSGGVSADQQGNNLTFGSNTAANAVNVKFGGLTATDGITTEAVLWTSGYNGGRTNITFDNGVTASALTASGFGNVTLANAAATSAATANQIAGPVTIVGGSLTTTNEYNLGSGTGNNYVVLNGGQWSANSGGTISAHNINMGPAGGILSINANTTYAASISDQSGLPTGISAGPLTIFVRTNNPKLTLSNTSPSANLWSGGTIVEGNNSSGTVTVNNGVNFGIGDVTVSSATLVLGGGNLGASANLNVSQGASVIFQSTATTPAIGSLEGAGSVVLGSSGAAVTLTVGGNNASTLFAGTISENDIGGGAGLHKTGTGTMTLAGVNTYTGATTVNAGTLKADTYGAIPVVSPVSVTGGALDVTALP